MQMVFQDPYGSLNGRMTLGETLAEPARVHGLPGGPASWTARAATLLNEVGLPRATLDRYPHKLSGGQRQRIAILGDVIYRLPALRTVLAQGDAGWAYRFDWRSPVEGGALGASHGFDEAFVWDATARAPYAAGSPDAPAVAATLRSALIRFARTGSPGWARVTVTQPHVELMGAHAGSRDDAA